MITEEKAKEVAAYASIFGDEATIGHFCLTAETLARYKRICKNDYKLTESKIVREITSKFSLEELRAIAKGRGLNKPRDTEAITFDGDEVVFGVISDPHMGAKNFIQAHMEAALEECEKQGVDTIFSPGDITEGMSNRAGHIYELTHLGYSAQKEYAQEMLRLWKGRWYLIDGNHDRWYEKAVGALIVKELAKELDHVTFLGHDEGDVSINGAFVRLWHGEDSGGAYAKSYRPQKIIEALPGGEKPQIMLIGHDHKQNYMFLRNVHVLSCGALSRQTWMRRTCKANDLGFHIVKTCIQDGQVQWFQPRWYPFY